jgi:ABC-type protease/lipase transport system fused ATPase/permease subunit
VFVLVNGGIVGRLEGIAGSGDEMSGVLIALIVLSVATFWLQHLVATFRLAYATRLGRMLDLRLRLRVMRATLRSTSLDHLDDPAFQDKLEAAREFSPASYKPGDSLFALTNLASLRLQGLFFALVIARFSLSLAIFLVGTSLFTRQILRSHFIETTKLLRNYSAIPVW